MNQFRLFAAAAAAAAAGLLAAMPTAAAVKTAKYTGTVVLGFDRTGVFAAPNTDLTGYSWVATYTYDKTLGGFQGTDGVSYDHSYGGPGFLNVGSPMLSSTITINGVTKSSAGARAGAVYTSTSSYVSHSSQDYSDDGISTIVDTLIYNYNYAAGAPASLDQNFGPVAASGGAGFVGWYIQDYAAGFTSHAYAHLGTSAVYSVSGAVPEPASWSLLIAGFGMVGAAARRRRSVAPTA